MSFIKYDENILGQGRKGRSICIFKKNNCFKITRMVLMTTKVNYNVLSMNESYDMGNKMKRGASSINFIAKETLVTQEREKKLFITRGNR
jgi:hypothetical protein